MKATQDIEDVRDIGCPKRPWVMLTFSDDEALVPGAALPPGLRFHLSRCASCRTVAEKLSGVTDTLEVIARESLPDDLNDRATARARSALRDGARLSGRVVLEDEPPIVGHTHGRAFRALSRYGSSWIGLAACIGLTVALVAGWRLWPGSNVAPQHASVNEWPHPASPTRWDLAGNDTDIAGPLPDAEPNSTSMDVDNPTDIPVAYVLAPEALDAARRQRAITNPPSPLGPPNRLADSAPDRLLDKTGPTVSTMTLTKDR